MRRLRALVEDAGLEAAGPMAARFYDDGAEGEDADYDVALPVVPRADGSVPDVVGEARGEWIPLHHVLEAVHTGPHDQDGRRVGGRARGVLRPRLHPGRAGHRGLRGDRADGVPPDRYVTRVRLPVRPLSAAAPAAPAPARRRAGLRS